MPLDTVERAALGDHLRAVHGSEHTPDARTAATIMPLRQVSVALDQVVNRSQDALRVHKAIPPDVARANDGDLAEAIRLHSVLELAAAAARSMIEHVRAQVGGGPSPTPPPAVPPPPAAPKKAGK